MPRLGYRHARRSGRHASGSQCSICASRLSKSTALIRTRTAWPDDCDLPATWVKRTATLPRLRRRSVRRSRRCRCAPFAIRLRRRSRPAIWVRSACRNVRTGEAFGRGGATLSEASRQAVALETAVDGCWIDPPGVGMAATDTSSAATRNEAQRRRYSAAESASRPTCMAITSPLGLPSSARSTRPRAEAFPVLRAGPVVAADWEAEVQQLLTFPSRNTRNEPPTGVRCWRDRPPFFPLPVLGRSSRA